MSIISDAAHEAARGLRAKLDAAALEALEAGFDWCESEMLERGDYFTIRPLWEPVSIEISVKGGRIPAGGDVPSGFRVIRNADWVAAGRPGRISTGELTK